MCERGQHQPQHHRRHGRVGALAEALRDIADVLDERKTDRGEAGVDQAVDHPVELAPPGAGEHHQQERALGRLLDDRSEEDQHRAAAEHRAAGQLQHQAGKYRDAGTPQEGQQQQSAGLRFPPVQPEVTGQHDRHQQRGQRHRDDQADGVLGTQDKQHQGRQRRQHDQHRDRCPGGPGLPAQRRLERRRPGRLRRARRRWPRRLAHGVTDSSLMPETLLLQTGSARCALVIQGAPAIGWRLDTVPARPTPVRTRLPQRVGVETGHDGVGAQARGEQAASGRRRWSEWPSGP